MTFRWPAALAVMLWSAGAAAQGIPLVPIDESDAGAAAPSAPVLVVGIDAGAADLATDAGAPDAGPTAVPLVSPVPLPEPLDAGAPQPEPTPDAGPAEVAPPDAGTQVLILREVDAGAPPSAAVAIADGGTSSEVDAGAPERVAQTENPGFVKGELSEYLGANRITVQTTRVGVGLGVSRITSIIYALLEPRLDLHLGDFGLGLAAPLNFEIFDAHLDPAAKGQVKFIGTRNAGTFRKEDYQTARDYARVVQYVTYGHKEDHLYVDIGQIYAHSIGHGEIMRRYQPDIDLDTIRIAAEVDAYNDYGGAELLTNDLLSANIVGGLLFVKPLSFASADPIARSFSVGFTYATDRTAPDALNINRGFAGSGLNGCDCRPVLVADSNGRYSLDTTRRRVSLFGLDAEVKLVKTDDIDVKPYVDLSHLVSGDSGLTVGVLGRFNFGGSPITPTQAVRLVLEGRYLGDRYQPEYFDTFYEVDKYIFLQRPTAASEPITKQQAVLQGFGSRAGYYAEASYGIRGWLGTTVALEGDSSTSAKNLVLHAELPKLFLLQLFGSYYKRGFTSFSTLTELDKNSIALAGVRLELLPILYVNGRAYQTFQLETENTHTYQTTRGLEGDVELGWQF